MQRANAKISEALRENSSNTISKDAAENRELKAASSSSPSKIDRKLAAVELVVTKRRFCASKKDNRWKTKKD